MSDLGGSKDKNPLRGMETSQRSSLLWKDSRRDREMIDRDVALLLIGGAIGLVSALVGALVQHLLSLRADRLKRERDRQEKKKEEWVRGAREMALLRVKDICGDIVVSSRDTLLASIVCFLILIGLLLAVVIWLMRTPMT